MGKSVPSAAFWLIAAGEIAAFIAGMATGMLGNWTLVPVAVGFLGLLAAAAWGGGGNGYGPLTDVTPNLILIVLPTILASAAISIRASVGAIAVVAVAIFWMRQSQRIRIAPAWPCAILPAIGLAIVGRPNYPSTAYTVVFFAVGCVVVAGAVFLSSSRSSALTSLNDGIGLFLVASVVLRLIGLDAQGSPKELLPNAITGGERVAFPLTSAQAATPAMATVYLAAVMPILLSSSRYRVPRLIALAAAIDVLVLADRRAALFGALFLAAGLLLVPRLFRRAAPYLVGASLIIPFIYRFVQAAVGQVMLAASSPLPWLLRPGESPTTLHGRDYVWSQSIDFYWNRVDKVHQTFGYGSFGNGASGVSANYGNLFDTLSGDRRLVTPHNSMLQLLFDGGWVFATVFAATICYLAWLLSRRSSATDLAGLAMLMALSIVGITEVALSPSHTQPTWWVLVALGMISFSKERSSPDQTDPMKPAAASRETPSTAPILGLKQQRATHE
jgi:hypothetical protein